MGWETFALLGLKGLQAASQISNANKQAKATIEQGNIALANKQKDIMRLAGSQQNSFLSSGLTLEGTPLNVIDSTFNSGITDLSQLSKNYNTTARNQISAGRTAALGSLTEGLGMAAFAGGFGSSPTDLNNVDLAGNGTTAWGTPVIDYNGGIDPGGVDVKILQKGA